MKKRSVRIQGHATSIALEPEFWAALEALAARRGLSLSALLTQVEVANQGHNLASALRVFVLRSLQQKT